MDTYSPDDIVFIFGQDEAHGFADGSFVKVSQLVDDASLSVGADGEATLVLSKNESVEVTLTLKASSTYNDVLSAARTLLKQRAGGIKPILLKDKGGSTLHFGKQAVVKKMPDYERGKEDSNVEWVFLVPRMQSFIGGRED